MFSPDTSAPTHSLRPKRTRQAAGNDDSVKLPQAKRKRSALRRDTFVEPLAKASLNEIAGRQSASIKTNGHIQEDTAVAASLPTHARELSIRGLKKTDKRSERGPGALTLTSNDFYNVSQLPSLPDQIRNRPSLSYTCLLSPEYGYALALTHTDGLIWPYNSSAATPSSRDVISFKLPLPPASGSDPLPLATFTARSANGEPGILIVSPRWGKVVYWETMSNASTFIPGQTSVGVQGSVAGMFNGETVKELVNSEPAGFILTFSHGRLAHLTVRDQLGRPAIGVQFLRKSSGTSRGGIFGSIKNVFGGDRRKGTPIVRPGSSTKGQRDVVVMTEDAELELWDTNISANHSLVYSTTFKDTLLTSLTSQVESQTNQPLHFRILDFELARSLHEVARKDQLSTIPLIVLLCITTSQQAQYYLVEISVGQSDANIKAVHSVKCYHDLISESDGWKPKLRVSISPHMAFIIFETAVVLCSLAKIRESPSSQLLMEKHDLPDPFQDCIRFQQDAIYKVLGCTSEDFSEQATCLIAVQGFGLARMTYYKQNNEDLEAEDYQDKISAKSKIEQAVFFGTIKQNPLNLSSTSGSEFTNEEIWHAALEISSEILCSKSKFLPRGGPSIEMQMKLRAKALDDLIQHLTKQYNTQVSRRLRYRLLWNAEKLAAGQAIWKMQEEIQRCYPLKDREMSYLDFTLRALHESRQKYPDEDKGEKDRVRHWLINSVDNTDHLLSELVSCIKELEPMDVTDPRVVGEYLIEALDLTIAAYTTAFKFREDSAPTYGLGDDVFEDGVLVAGYPPTIGIPWTSKPEPIRFASQLINDVCLYLGEWWEYTPETAKSKKKKMPTDTDGNPHAPPPDALLKDLAKRLPVEVQLFNSIVSEEIINAIRHEEVIQKDPEARKRVAAEIRAEKRPRMHDAISQIAKFNPSGAIELAERLKDPGLLVTLTTDYILALDLDSRLHIENASKNKKKIVEIQDHAESYYDRFGNGWAYANFSRKVENGELGSLLVEGQAGDGKKQRHLTWFLKKGLKLGQPIGKISWINDVVGESSFTRAAKTLASVAENEETDLWNQKTQLSLAKLAQLASIEDKQVDEDQLLACHLTVEEHEDKISLIDLQSRLANHVSAALGATLDTKAAEDLAISIFTKRVVEKSPALKKLLASGLRGLVNARPSTAEQLIDILTLMDPVETDETVDEEVREMPTLGEEFFLALEILRLSPSTSVSLSKKKELKKLVWRRAMIRDDWLVLNDTTGLDDAQVRDRWFQTALWRTLARLFLERDRRVLRDENGDYVVQDWILSPAEIMGADTHQQQPQQEQESSQNQTENKDTPPTSTPPASTTAAPSNAKETQKDLLKSFALPAALAERFFDEKEREAVRKDLAKEQARLREFVEKAQLEGHFSGLVSAAELWGKEHVGSGDVVEGWNAGGPRAEEGSA